MASLERYSFADLDARRGYQFGKIYALRSTATLEFYVGSTKQTPYARWRTGWPWLDEIFRRTGTDTWRMEIIERWPCGSRNELLSREQYWIDLLQPTLNSQPAISQSRLVDSAYRSVPPGATTRVDRKPPDPTTRTRGNGERTRAFLAKFAKAIDLDEED